MLRAVLFDFNGVLVDDEPLHLELFQRVLAEEGLALSPEEYYSRYLGLDDESCFAAVLAKAGRDVPEGLLARWVDRKAAYYRAAILRGGYPFFAGVRELVGEIADRGLRLGVVSGALRDEVEGALRQAGLRLRFEVLVTAEDVRQGKPHPEGYRRGLELFNARPSRAARLLHPHEVLAVEDSPTGLQAARAAGLVTLGVAHTLPPRQLVGLADTVAGSLAELGVAQLQSLVVAASRA